MLTVKGGRATSKPLASAQARRAGRAALTVRVPARAGRYRLTLTAAAAGRTATDAVALTVR
jgi:hypothetical protein